MTTTLREFSAKPAAVTLAGLWLAVSLAVAQPVRISHPLDVSKTKVLVGNRPTKAYPLAEDDGPLNPFDRISGITLIFRPSPRQAADLEKLLREQRDPSSPNYHRWLTPEQYADRFGLNQDDLGQVSSWLRTEGFNIDYVARARTSMRFNGTAGQVRNAFHTELHRYHVDGQLHFANSADPSIPAALDPVVLLIRGLDDLRTKPRKLSVTPVASFTSSGGGHSLVPGDIATIYDISPLYQRGITGLGQKIAVVGQTDINLSDIEHFRSQYGLPFNDPKLVLADGSPDPGVSADDLVESSLDLEYSGGIAPDATILFVYSTDVWTSIEYAIDQALAPIISTSYGYCEPQNSSVPNSMAAYFETLAQQANSMGITWLASSGDTGAADCDLPLEQMAIQGLAVDLPASVPEVTGVGGTEFAEGSAIYWEPVNGGTGNSALSYIPEVAWNDTASMDGLLSTGGGASILFPKPVWQSGAGVPDDEARDVPDVSFAASAAHDPYQIYANGEAMCVGGTSAPTPVFSGVLALLNQYLAATGSHSQPGLGNINPMLYRLAQSTPQVFHDVTAGSNIVPCANISRSCSRGQFGYPADVGYDQATGLGSVDVYSFVTLWNGRPTPRDNHHLDHDRLPLWLGSPSATARWR
jgi:subtilase family serine protease